MKTFPKPFSIKKLEGIVWHVSTVYTLEFEAEDTSNHGIRIRYNLSSRSSICNQCNNQFSHTKTFLHRGFRDGTRGSNIHNLYKTTF